MMARMETPMVQASNQGMQIQQDEKPVMAFVNEYISEEDIEKYDIKGIFQQLQVWLWKDIFENPLPGSRLSWTIDRERDVFIMSIIVDGEEFSSNRGDFALWWKGQVLSVVFEMSSTQGPPFSGKVTTTRRLRGIAYPDGKAFDGDKDAVIRDLKDALAEYKLPIILSGDYTAIFEILGETIISITSAQATQRPNTKIDGRKNMAFVNEYISEEDLEKYNIESVLGQLGISQESFRRPRLPGSRRQWTIDRERDVFIMCIDAGREEFSGQLVFALWWKGQVLSVGLENFFDSGSLVKVTTTWRLRGIAYPDGKAFDGDQDAVIRDLKDALTEYKVHGINPAIADHTAVFEF